MALTATMTTTTTRNSGPGQRFQYPSSQSSRDTKNPLNPYPRPQPSTNAGIPGPRTPGTGPGQPGSAAGPAPGPGSTTSGPRSVRSSFGGSESSLSSVNYAIAIPVRQSQDIGKLLADIESKPILLETNEDLDLSMSLTKAPSMWSLNDQDGSVSGGKPASVTSQNSRVSFVSGSSIAGSAWNIVPPPESKGVIDNLTAFYLPLIAILLIGLSILFTVVSFVNPYWMKSYGRVFNVSTCPDPWRQEILLVGFLDVCTGYKTNYNCEQDETLVIAASAIFKIGVAVFWVGLILVFFQIIHQIRLNLYIGGNSQTFELRKADRKSYGRHKGVQIIVLGAICLCAILSSLCFIISMAVMSYKDESAYTENGIRFRPSFITTGVAAALTMFCGWITSAQIFYHVSGTRAETTIALSPGVKFVKTFQALAPPEGDEDNPEYNGEGARLELSTDTRTQRADSVDDDFRTLPTRTYYPGLQKARNLPGRIPSITQKLEDRDTLLKRSLGRSESKRKAPQLPPSQINQKPAGPRSKDGSYGPKSGPPPARYDRSTKPGNMPSRYGESSTSKPMMKSYDTTTSSNLSSRYNDYYSNPKSQNGGYGGVVQDGRQDGHKQPMSREVGQSNQSKGVTRTESNRDTTIPSHYNRPRPKPSFRNVRPKKPAPSPQDQELQMLPTRIPNATSPRQTPISTGADVHASGHRSSTFI